MFGSNNMGDIYNSLDNGNTWNKLYSNPIRNSLPFSSEAVIYPVDSNEIFATYAQGIMKTLDNGKFWVSVNQGLNYPLQYDNAGFGIYNLLFINSTHIIAGTPYGLYISSDEGQNWNFLRM